MSIVLVAVSVIAVGLLLMLALVVQKLRRLQEQQNRISNAETEIARLKDEAAHAVATEKTDTAAAIDRQKREAAAEVELLRKNIESLREEAAALVTANKNQHEALDKDYATAKVTYDRLAAEVTLLEENLNDISFGLYTPHFNFDTPDEYKARIEAVREAQKLMLKSGAAAQFAIAWSVGGSRREGERMQKQYMKLLLRAFNGECDAAVARVSWNNVTKMEERIRKSFEVINDLGGVMHVSIASPYLELKIDELRLEYELEEKKHQAGEEQRRIREQMRDEEKARREAEQAQEESEAEETLFERALEKARLDLAKSQGEEHKRLNDRIIDLQTQLE